MSKDPAFLFYSNDFLSGTFTMTDEQVGKYIRLLCIQHQKGVLTKKDMKNICKTYDEDIYSKFEIDKDSNYYNLRLKEESDKRKAYAESRRNNRLKAKVSKTYVQHMENENENKDKNKDKKKKQKDFERKAESLYDNYKTLIKAGASADAKKNIVSILKNKLADEFELEQCIINYREYLDIKETHFDYYYQANNFFGKKAYWQDFREDEYIRPEPSGLTDKEREIEAKNDKILKELGLK